MNDSLPNFGAPNSADLTVAQATIHQLNTEIYYLKEQIRSLQLQLSDSRSALEDFTLGRIYDV